MRSMVPAVLMIAGFLLPAGVAAQPAQGGTGSIMGSVVDASSGESVVGATVIATGDDGGILRGVLTDSGGRFILDRLAEHPARIIVERLGYGSVTLPLAPAAVLEALIVRLAPSPIRLEAVTASGESLCEPDPAGSERTHGLWNAARTSLRAALVSEQEGLVRFRVTTWVREVDAQGGVLAELQGGESVVVRQPFVTRAADLLALDGYVVRQGIDFTYFGPDASVLLSEEFLTTHCFQAAASPPGAMNLVGLAFEPLPRRTLPDIAGTFWIEPTTGELRLVEYRYVEGDRPFRLGGDGEIRFRTLSEGPWVVDFWRIRAPIGLDGRRQVTFYEAGGALLEVLSAEQ